MYKNQIDRYLKAALVIIIIVIGTNAAFSQINYFKTNGESNVKITGTSSLHDWQMYAPIVGCSLGIKNSSKGNSIELIDIEFQLAVDHLKSEHKKMDDIAQKALKINDFPNISFQSTTPQIILINNGDTQNKVKGTLEIAGVEKEIELIVLSAKKDESGLQFKFSFPIIMEDYQVKPPSFMFGTVTTGSEIIASFDLYFNKLNQ